MYLILLYEQSRDGGSYGASRTRVRPGGLPLVQDVADLWSELIFDSGGNVIEAHKRVGVVPAHELGGEDHAHVVGNGITVKDVRAKAMGIFFPASQTRACFRLEVQLALEVRQALHDGLCDQGLAPKRGMHVVIHQFPANRLPGTVGAKHAHQVAYWRIVFVRGAQDRVEGWRGGTPGHGIQVTGGDIFRKGFSVPAFIGESLTEQVMGARVGGVELKNPLQGRNRIGRTGESLGFGRGEE